MEVEQFEITWQDNVDKSNQGGGYNEPISTQVESSWLKWRRSMMRKEEICLVFMEGTVTRVWDIKGPEFEWYEFVNWQPCLELRVN